MTTIHTFALIFAVLLLIYLFIAMFRPEWF
jgi:K+-transporting ATPase KdpF subunit